MPQGLPGLAGTEHIGLTVPDLEAATRFFVDVIGCEVVFEAGPYASDGDWMADHLGVHPRAEIRKLRMLRCANGPALELFEYAAPDQSAARPRNSDHAGHHLAFYVTDLAAGVAHLEAHGVTILGGATRLTEGATGGLDWVYFLAPWGLQLELVSYPRGLAYEAGATVKLWSPMGDG